MSDDTGSDGRGASAVADGHPGDDAGSTSPIPRPVLFGALGVLGVLVVVGLLLARGVVSRDETPATDPTAPLAVVTVPAPDAGSAECTEFVSALPEKLGDASVVEMREPAPEGARAYRMPDGQPLVVRCGLPAPPGFVVGSPLQQVSEVQWFSEADPDPTVTASTWVTVDRERYVAVTLPGGSGTGPIQDLSALVAKTMPAVEPRPAPLPEPSGATPTR